MPPLITPHLKQIIGSLYFFVYLYGYESFIYSCLINHINLIKMKNKKVVYESIAFFLLSIWMVIPSFAGDSDSIPFLYRRHIYFNVVLNGAHSCNVIFDTGGADIFGVDSVFLVRSQWSPKNLHSSMIRGGAGSTKVKVITDGTNVKFGSMQRIYKVVPILLLRDIIDCHVDGIIGIKDIMDGLFEINFEKEYMKKHSSLPQKASGYERIPIQVKNNKIMIRAETRIGEKNIKGWYLVDTGGTGTIDFTAATVARYGLETLERKKYITDITQFGIGAKEKEFFVEMQSDMIVIGRDTMPNKVVSYLPKGVGAFSERDWIGVIGNEIWSNYNMIIDIKNKVLYLQRFKPNTPEGPRYDYRFRNRTDICDGWIVSSLVRDGDAVRAGMILGDTIMMINGKAAKDYTWDEELDLRKAPIQTLSIIGKDGRKKEVLLRPKERWKSE